MPAQFEYSGVDGSGQPIKGLTQGESPIDAVLQLKGAGVTVYSIKKKLLPEDKPFLISKRIGASDLISFNEQLASLLKSKLPLTDSLSHLSKELANPRLKAAMEKITGQLEAGRDLSESLATQRDYFPPLYISMVAAGEKSGNLAEVLFQAANYFKTTDVFRRKLLNILIYPAILIMLSAAVLIFLIKLMVPPYVDLYSGFHIVMPLSLSILVWLERFLSLNMFWRVFAPLLLVGLAALLFAVRRSESMRMHFGGLILRIPVWGKITRDAILARSIATLSILLRSGVPLCESLSIIKNLISIGALREAFGWTAEQVSKGDSLSETLVKQPIFPLELATLVRNGEARGELIASLDDASRMYQDQFDFSARTLLSIVEPVLLIIMGAIVVSIAVSLFYPLYSLSKYLGT